MSVTRPSVSSKLTLSPIRNGWETPIWTPATMLPSVCWAAKPTISAITAEEASTPVASRSRSVNWARASIPRMTSTVTTTRRRSRRSRVLVERETCETAGDMDANLTATAPERDEGSGFPYSNWGPGAAVLGVVMAIGAGILLGIPAAFFPKEPDGDLSAAASSVAQLGLVMGFLLVPMAIASWRGAASIAEILRRLGVRAFEASALKWMAATVGAYL